MDVEGQCDSIAETENSGLEYTKEIEKCHGNYAIDSNGNVCPLVHFSM